MSHEEKKKAAAIKYSPGEPAPEVIAKGQGIVADKLLEKAKESDVPVYKDEKLVNELARLELGDYIPEELYQIVAEIMVFVNDLDKMKDKTQ